MRGLWYVLILVLGTGLMAACDRDEESGGLATAPSLASAASQCSNLNQAVSAAFTNNTTRQNVQAIAQNMVQAFGANPSQKGKATWYGFQVLEAIDTAGRFQGTLLANSNLAVGTFPCMSLGTATLPTSLVRHLGDSGAFSVRGRPTADFDEVLSHDGVWIIEPPEDSSWQATAALQARANIIGDTANLFLALGTPGSSSGFVGTGDTLVVGTFDWATIPTATFEHPYVVVGNCTEGGGFLQHYAFNNSNAAIFGVLQPTQCPTSGAMLEPAPRSLVERLLRAFSPAPAYATALLGKTGGGSKPALSPFGITKPGKVNLSKFTTSPSKSGNVKNQLFTPTPVINPKSAGGVSFKQASVLSYLVPIANLGSPGNICFNWDYNDDEGVTAFSLAFYTKAGGLQLRAKTVGTITTDESTGQPVPEIPAGADAVSASFNVKNSEIPVNVCPVFDGTKYYTNILDPSVQPITFNPNNAATFPPNYDTP
ncbi:MAG TPA: hypothetical protein VM365_03860 [Gemmatimonadales bacterium]|nr:hypothetical protein [Gemmatimonadales bacterium]